MITGDVEYVVDDTTMIGRLALPEGDERRPGVLIAHEGNGLDDLQKARAERFAALGYVAFALDYYGGGAPLTDRDVVGARMMRLWGDTPLARAVAQAGLHVLLGEARTDPARVAAVGYCYGGALVMELARGGADLEAVVGFHPGLSTPRPQDSASIRGAVLVCIGGDDPLIGLDDRIAFEAEMRDAGIDWRMCVFGGAQHSFTHPNAAATGRPGLAYDRRTDERSWRAMLDLFAETIDA